MNNRISQIPYKPLDMHKNYVCLIIKHPNSVKNISFIDILMQFFNTNVLSEKNNGGIMDDAKSVSTNIRPHSLGLALAPL